MRDTIIIEQANDIISKKQGYYIHFAAADRLGNALATLEAYQDRDWTEIEPEAQRLWKENHDRPWSEFGEVVRQAWAETRTQFSTKVVPEEDPTSYRAIFRHHYETHYADKGQYDYDEYALAYHFGYDLAVDGRLRQVSWTEIEPTARQFWQSQGHTGPWEDFKTAVNYAWTKTQKIRRE